MISKKKIEDFLNDEFADGDVFLVDVVINAANSIRVYVDKPLGISINECYDISRKITGEFSRDEEDYSLDVSSPGLDMPLRVAEQYVKNIDKDVEVLLNDGKKHKGILKSYNSLAIEIEEKKKIAVEGKKNKQWQTQLLTINFDDIKTVKVVISFN
ncbi:MAG: ribosome assembly cofactor RimP [Bacteroidales bacterium]|nr:ribosome assembly cofactor RimP [Bacteroidales bacterium]MCF8390653.1 ribosome assembly cofactor RimP [Bacteroidales bacterium]